MDDSCIQVSIYDDRVEVLSPGMLYGGLDMEEALKGKSKCRNAAISEAFYYMGIIEGWGTGLGRIQKSCYEYGLKKPMIEEFGNGFRVVLFRKGTSGTGIGTKIGTSGTGIGTKIGTSGTDEQDLTKLSEEELLVVQIMKENPQITQSQLWQSTGIPLRTIKRITTGLQKNGIVIRTGSHRQGSWHVKEK